MENKDLIQNLKKLAADCYNHYVETNAKVRLLEEVPIAEALIGKCFKTRYSHGGPKKGFWIYERVVGRSDTTLLVDVFSEDNYGKVDFDYSKPGYLTQFTSHTSITEEEYFKAQRKLLNKLLVRSKEDRKKK